jgi:hypothetical protein
MFLMLCLVASNLLNLFVASNDDRIILNFEIIHVVRVQLNLGFLFLYDMSYVAYRIAYEYIPVPSTVHGLPVTWMRYHVGDGVCVKTRVF